MASRSTVYIFTGFPPHLGQIRRMFFGSAEGMSPPEWSIASRTVSCPVRRWPIFAKSPGYSKSWSYRTTHPRRPGRTFPEPPSRFFRLRGLLGHFLSRLWCFLSGFWHARPSAKISIVIVMSPVAGICTLAGCSSGLACSRATSRVKADGLGRWEIDRFLPGIEAGDERDDSEPKPGGLRPATRAWRSFSRRRVDRRDLAQPGSGGSFPLVRFQ